MLILFETPAGYALLELQDEGKLKKISDLSEKYISDSKAFGKV